MSKAEEVFRFVYIVIGSINKETMNIISLSYRTLHPHTYAHTHIRKHPISMVKIKPRIKIVDIGLFCVELCQMNRELIKKNEGEREREFSLMVQINVFV